MRNIQNLKAFKHKLCHLEVGDILLPTITTTGILLVKQLFSDETYQVVPTQGALGKMNHSWCMPVCIDVPTGLIVNGEPAWATHTIYIHNVQRFALINFVNQSEMSVVNQDSVLDLIFRGFSRQYQPSSELPCRLCAERERLLESKRKKHRRN